MAGQSLTLHEDPRSGNCYKIKLTAALVGKPLDVRQYDIMSGETRTDAFLANINPNGRIPVLQIGEGPEARFLPESNAACWYLGSGTSLVPEDAFAQADCCAGCSSNNTTMNPMSRRCGSGCVLWGRTT
ncbi:MAG: glutathione S-transferase N-terminal domain-containing protein [Pseudomonadota bacterium]|nr:glutathione S-transferase N-terminal domain-containing protein [Pseudomonadota bacterium]